MKVIYNKRISRKGNFIGKETLEKIESCKDCHWSYNGKCDFSEKCLNKDNSIPAWCPLDDYPIKQEGGIKY